jgi:hypothetical protein
MTATTTQPVRLSRIAAGLFSAFDSTGRLWLVARDTRGWRVALDSVGAFPHRLPTKSAAATFIAKQG